MDNIRERTGQLAAMTPYDCWSMLEGRHVGRVAWSRADTAPGIVPVNLRVMNGAIWFRTAPSSALATEGVGTLVSVEVDEVDLSSRSGWSVVVEGIATPVDDEQVPDLVHALQVWPAGDRSVHVRVEPLQVTGRRLRNSPGAIDA